MKFVTFDYLNQPYVYGGETVKQIDDSQIANKIFVFSNHVFVEE
jgi:hypothetical protein